MNTQIIRFLQAIDQELGHLAAERERLDLYLLGRCALILRHALSSGTKDVDIVWMQRSPLEEKARELFCRESSQARQLGLYLDLVPQGLPPLPGGFQNRCTALSGDW